MLLFDLIQILPTVPLMFVFLARTPFCICPASLASSNLWELPSLSLLFRTCQGTSWEWGKVYDISLSLNLLYLLSLLFFSLWGGRKQTPFYLKYATFCLVSDFLSTWLVSHGCGRTCPHAYSLFPFRIISVLACGSWSINVDWAGFRHWREFSACEPVWAVACVCKHL